MACCQPLATQNESDRGPVIFWVDKAEENESSVVSTSSLFINVVRGVYISSLQKCSVSLTTRLSDCEGETHTKKTHTHCRGVVRTLVDIIRPDTFLSRFQIRRVCILLNADSLSLFLFPPALQPHSLFLFVLLTCFILETPQLFSAVQTTLEIKTTIKKQKWIKKSKRERKDIKHKTVSQKSCLPRS